MTNTTKAQPIKRSKIYQDHWPDNYMLEAFGKLDPTISERKTYFFERFMEWREHRIRIKQGCMPKVKEILKHSGLQVMWEYQVMHNEVRFSKAEHLAWIRLVADIDKHIIVNGWENSYV